MQRAILHHYDQHRYNTHAAVRTVNSLPRAPVGGAAAATPAPLTETAKAEQAATASAAEGYAFFNLAETAFVEALVDHMVPADELSPKGTDIGINVYIDRALAGGWGKGERLYMQ